MRSTMRSAWPVSVVVVFALTEPGFAQKLVDPNAVAPEYREAAEKRRAEQMKLLDCRHKAEAAKVLPRDRADAITHCMADGPAPSPTATAVRQ
jgi:hypothetical protein